MTTNARDILNRHTSEADFQDSVIELAQRTGWLVFHLNDQLLREAVKSGRLDALTGIKSFPDTICVHPELGKLAILECKTETGRVESGQLAWIDGFARVFFEIACGVVPELRATGPSLVGLFPGRIMIDVVRPRDWDRIEAFLTGA